VIRQVASLTYTPVKGTSLVRPGAVDVGAGGIAEDRLFHLLDAADGRQVGSSPKLLPVVTTYRPDARELAVQVPTGQRALAEVRLGEAVTAKIAWDKDRPLESRKVLGPWDCLLSEYLGRHVVLAQAIRPAGAVDVEPITLVSHASISRLERELQGQPLGTERFRMNLNLEGLAEHEEDQWYGRRIAIGSAVLRVTGPIPRCVVTTLNPATGERDASTLKGIVRYRAPIPVPGSALPVKVPFGVYARVEQPGRIEVGDKVELLD
jgi:uncharacterized protein YcbX